MTASRSPRPAAVAALAVLALVGCSGGDAGGGPTSSTTWTPGPLDEYQARIYGYSLDREASARQRAQADGDRQHRRFEEAVAACMAEQGFDYTPAESGGVVYASEDPDVVRGTREFAERYGYEISAGPSGDGDAGGGAEWEDPNAEYVRSMSASEAAAWSEALYGREAPGDGDDLQEDDVASAGCYGAAQHEVYAGGGVLDEFAGLQQELARFAQTVQADPRVAELESAWASCMADRGYPSLRDVATANQALAAEWEDLRGTQDPGYLAELDAWDWAAEPGGPPAPEVDPAAVAVFTEKEIGQAVADVECQEQVGYWAGRLRVDRELQQEFVDRHGDELEAWATAATAARGE
ncbi:hypothetical protein [Cellulomonas pakistanensis]|nr:hypothetical protein [Cellulomonas pakistanensis]